VSAVHYRRALVPGIWQPERGTACGYGLTGPPISLPVTDIQADVTCVRCRRAANLDPGTSENRVMAVLRAADGYLTVAAAARAAQVSRARAGALLHRLDAEGRVDVDRSWPNSYRLRAEAAER
jgi:hypothetical protein